MARRALFFGIMEVRGVSRHKVLGMLCGLAWAGHSTGLGFVATGRGGPRTVARTTRCAQSDADAPAARVPALRFLGDPELMQPQPEVGFSGSSWGVTP